MTKQVMLQERNRIVEAFGERREPLRPASIDEAVDGKISYSSLENGLTLRFPFVEGMEVGGEYIFLSSSDEGVGHNLRGTIQAENQDIVAALPPDQALGFSGKLDLQYRYLGFPPEHSFSPPTYYSVEGWLYRPLVDEAVDGVIPVSAVSRGVNLRIKAALSLEKNAAVSVYWVGSNSDACFVEYRILQADHSKEDIVIPVGSAFLVPNKNGHVHFIYTVHSNRGTWTSKLVRLEVEGELGMPTAKYWLPEELILAKPARLVKTDEGGKIPMQVPTQGCSEGDVATFIFVSDHFRGEFIFRLPVTSGDIAQGYKPFNLPIPFTLLAGSNVTFMAVVERQTGGTVGSPVNKLYVEAD